MRLTDLERLLELLFDYVSPVDVQVRPTDAERVAESLAAQLRGQGGEVAVAAVPAVRVLADPARARPQLPVARRRRARAWGGSFAVAVTHDVAAERVAVRGATARPMRRRRRAARRAGRRGRRPSDRSAGRRAARSDRAGCACAVTLPVAS